MRLTTSFAGLLVITALVLSATVYAGFALHKEGVVDAERRSLEATAEGIGENLGTRLAEKRRMVELGAAAPEASAFGTDGPQGTVERLIAKTRFDGASIVSKNGSIQAMAARNLNASRERALIGTDLSDRTYVKKALEGNTYVGEKFVARSGNLIVVISTPVYRDGTVVGTMNGAIHLRRSRIFTSLSSSLKEGQSLLVSRHGQPIYRHGSPRGEFLVASEHVAPGNWSLVVGQDRDSIQGAIRMATTAQAGAVGLTLLAIGLVGWWIYRTTIGHINRLIDGLSRLEGGDYDPELDLGVTHEWSRISTQFNALAETLDQRDSQLRVLNRVLRHNLRNDMSVIVAYADSMLHEAADGDSTAEVEQIRKTATNLIQTSEHARAIYEKLLGESSFEKSPVDATRVVEGEAANLRREFPESTVETDLPDSAMTYDSDTLSIVVNEVARNALIHNDRPEAERTVTISVDRADGDVELSVRDNGPGLPGVEAALLTGSLQETSFEHGSGLGLWVVNWLVDQLGGVVSVTSPGDRGTTVVVRLPGVESDGGG